MYPDTIMYRSDKCIRPLLCIGAINVSGQLHITAIGISGYLCIRVINNVNLRYVRMSDDELVTSKCFGC
jgi:hypothetical protein